MQQFLSLQRAKWDLDAAKSGKTTAEGEAEFCCCKAVADSSGTPSSCQDPEVMELDPTFHGFISCSKHKGQQMCETAQSR